MSSKLNTLFKNDDLYAQDLFAVSARIHKRVCEPLEISVETPVTARIISLHKPTLPVVPVHIYMC